ncbi:hypothetical protein ACTU6U_13575 [Microbacterium sp. A196]|uniref:hypothetical protein n=1 Tax=Microbacterium sp. A196 TaxID=3457320 RepID=UPI003FD212AC
MYEGRWLEPQSLMLRESASSRCATSDAEDEALADAVDAASEGAAFDSGTD